MVVMLAQGAAQWHQAVARQAVCQRAAPGRHGRGHRVAGHACGQGHRQAIVGLALKTIAAVPVRIEHVAVAQVGDAGAAQLAQPGEGRAVGGAAEDHVDPVAGPLQRRAVVRRAQEDDAFQAIRPAQAAQPGVVDRTADQQTPHAVGHHGQCFDRHGPVRQQLLKPCRQFMAVLRHMQSRVVAQVDGRVAQRGRQYCPMVDRLPFLRHTPLQVVHAQAVDQQQCPAGGAGQRRHAPQVQGLAPVAQGHGRCQRVAGRHQPVAQHAVERGEHRLALRRIGPGPVGRLEPGLQPGQQLVKARAQQL